MDWRKKALEPDDALPLAIAKESDSTAIEASLIPGRPFVCRGNPEFLVVFRLQDVHFVDAHVALADHQKAKQAEKRFIRLANVPIITCPSTGRTGSSSRFTRFGGGKNLDNRGADFLVVARSSPVVVLTAICCGA